jgi:hypothetical protein
MKDTAKALALSILQIDRDYPGDQGAEMIVDAETWQELLELAREVAGARRTGNQQQQPAS